MSDLGFSYGGVISGAELTSVAKEVRKCGVAVANRKLERSGSWCSGGSEQVRQCRVNTSTRQQ